MPGRQFNAGDYRYGMNGQEKDNEIFQGAYTAEYWEYDSRIGRRWNIDPIDQISISNYACFANNPIYATDAAGSNTNTPISNPETGDKVGGATYNGENWDLNEVKITPTTSEEVTKREAELNSPVRHYEPTAQQKGIYKSMDQFGKGMFVGAISIPSIFVAVESGFAWWALKAAGVGALEELAGLPSPEGWGGRQVVKQVEKKIIKDAVQEISPYELTITHGLKKSKKDMADLKLKVMTDGKIKETIKYVQYNGNKYVVDGHHRLRIAKELDFSTVPVEEVQLPFGNYKTNADLIFEH
jgi:RHS repeat-associated protein